MVQMRPTTALLFALILLCTLSGPTHCAVADQHLPIKGEGLLDRRTAPFFESPSQVLPGDSSQSYPENSSQSYPEDSSQSYPEDSSQSYPEDSSQSYPEDSSHAHHEDSSHPHHGDSSHAHHEDSSQSYPEDSSQSYPKDFFHAHPEDSSQSYPEDSSQSYPEDSSQSYPEDSSQSYPEDSSHAHHEDSSHPHHEDSSQSYPEDSSQSYPNDFFHAHPEDSSQSYPEDSSHAHHGDSSHPHHEDSSHAHHGDSSHAHHGDSSHPHHEDSSHGSPDVPKPTILKYDDNLSLKALRYSKAAHCSIEELKKCKHGHACDVFPSFELHRVRRDDFHESLCYTGVQHNDKRIVVAFHANFTLLGVIEDLLLDKVPYHNKACGSNCKVHANTYIAYQYLRKNIVKDVLRLRRAHPDYSLLVTAHSLGGALATLCAVDLAAFPTVDHGSKLQDVSLLESSQYQRRHHGFGTHKLTPTHLYTFGQPRVGNPDFARWASSVLSKTSTFRVTHGRDPVPHLPPGFLDYIHLPHEVWYGNPENPDAYRLCVDSPTAEDRKCSASLLPISVSDHLYYLGLFMGCDTVELMDNSDTNLEALNSYAKFNKDHYSYFEHNE